MQNKLKNKNQKTNCTHSHAFKYNYHLPTHLDLYHLLISPPNYAFNLSIQQAYIGGCKETNQIFRVPPPLLFKLFFHMPPTVAETSGEGTHTPLVSKGDNFAFSIKCTHLVTYCLVFKWQVGSQGTRSQQHKNFSEYLS